MRVRPSASVHAEACARSGARGPPPAMPPAFTDGVPVGEACSPTRGDPDACPELGPRCSRPRGQGLRSGCLGTEGPRPAMLRLAVHRSHECHSILLALPGHPRSSRGWAALCGCRLPPRHAGPRLAHWGAARPSWGLPLASPHVLRVRPAGRGRRGRRAGPRLPPPTPCECRPAVPPGRPVTQRVSGPSRAGGLSPLPRVCVCP